MQNPSSLPPWDTHEPQSTLLSTTPSETHEKHGSVRSLKQDRNNTKRRQKHAVKTGDTDKVAIEDAQLVKDDLAIMQHQESPFMSNKTEYLAKAIEQHDNRARIERSNINNLILANMKSQENILEGQTNLITGHDNLQTNLIAGHENLVKTNLNSHSSLILNQAKSNEDSGKRFYDEMGKLVDSEKRFYDEMGKLVRKVKSSAESAEFEVIDPMIKFLLHANDDANPDEFLNVVRSNFSFVSSEQFFLRIADLVDLETDPVEVCKYKTLAASLVSAFFKLGLFAFPDDDVCDSIDGEDAAAAATGHLSNNLFVDNISHSIDSDSTNAWKFFTPKKQWMRLDDNDGEIEKTAAEHLLLFSASQSRSEPLLPFKQEEVVSTGASAQSEKKRVVVQEIPIRQHPPQVEGTIGLVSKPSFPPTSSYSLLEFLAMKKDCLKVTPNKFHSWLVEQDIVSMDDLIDACKDEDFDNDEMRNGGLKAFKQKGFIKAVTS